MLTNEQSYASFKLQRNSGFTNAQIDWQERDCAFATSRLVVKGEAYGKEKIKLQHA